MEIGPVPFFNQEDCSNFYSFFQDFDTSFLADSYPQKRQKVEYCEDENVSDPQASVKEILCSLLSFEKNPDQESQNPSMGDAEKSGSKRPRGEVDSSSDDSASNPSPTGHRRLWVKDRSKAWWEQCNSPDFPESEFRNAFRMSKSTFNMICEELDSAVNKKDTMLRQAIPVRQRVAVCVNRLATGDPLRVVSKRFGLGISTCHKLVLEVCSAIKTVLMRKYIQWPDENQIKEVKNAFGQISGVSNVGGTIYTTHVPIIAPKNNVAAYFNKRHTERNQKTSYSITVQGVVNPQGFFTDVCIGWPGSMPDDKVLEKSALYKRANTGLLRDIWVVGNAGYSLMDWLLVPYTHQNLTWTQHAFNEKIEEMQRVAKEAFMRMKARWSCLQKRTEVKLQDLPAVLGACCVLHNICEMRNEAIDEMLRFELFDDEMVAENSMRSVGAMRARDHIAHDLLHRSSHVSS
ncbi:hypothetical protein RJ639_006356 [Escallonia herrerae]|uniref:DDE Tnp4 domain-containing protein n=1 Tax=Escallonia herrerae TaxID=1293975 RepID=A0AA89AVG5_9ASTE|nr:hypothetical protein RJ639_006356 [Escallonia herrerae]